MIEFRRDVLNVVGGLVAFGLVAILAFITWALVYRAIPNGNESTLIQLVGGLVAQVGIVVAFFFGNNVSSKKQSETINTLADTAKAAQQAAAPKEAAISLQEGESVKVQARDDAAP